MKIDVEEYKGLTAKDICDKTGLPNPYSNGMRYSRYRQLELMLKDAQKNGVLHLIEKTNEKKHSILNINEDKDLMILSKKQEDKINYTSNLNLNTMPHKVERQYGNITITVNQSDIPVNVIKNPKPGHVYNVIGIFIEKKCYYSNYLYDGIGQGAVGSVYKFSFDTKVKLIIMKK